MAAKKNIKKGAKAAVAGAAGAAAGKKANSKSTAKFIASLEKIFDVKYDHPLSKPISYKDYGPNKGQMTKQQLQRALNSKPVYSDFADGFFKAMGMDDEQRKAEVQEMERVNFVHEQLERQERYLRAQAEKKAKLKNDNWFERNISTPLGRGKGWALDQLGKAGVGVGKGLEAAGLKDEVEFAKDWTNKFGVMGAIEHMARPSYAVNNAILELIRLDDDPNPSKKFSIKGIKDIPKAALALGDLAGISRSFDEIKEDPLNALRKIGGGFKDGFTGKEKTTNADTLKYISQRDPDSPFGQAMDNSWVRNITGFGLDVALDPLSYVGVGAVTKGATLAGRATEKASLTKAKNDLLLKLDQAKFNFDSTNNRLKGARRELESLTNSAPVGKVVPPEAGVARAVEQEMLPQNMEAFEDVITADKVTEAIKSESARNWRSKPSEQTFGAYQNAKRELSKDPDFDADKYTYTTWANEPKSIDDALGPQFSEDPNLSKHTPSSLLKQTKQELFKNNKEYRQLQKDIKVLMDRRHKILKEVIPLWQAGKQADKALLGKLTLEEGNLSSAINGLRRRQEEMLTNAFVGTVNNVRKAGSKKVYSEPEFAEHLKTLINRLDDRFEQQNRGLHQDVSGAGTQSRSRENSVDELNVSENPVTIDEELSILNDINGPETTGGSVTSNMPNRAAERSEAERKQELIWRGGGKSPHLPKTREREARLAREEAARPDRILDEAASRPDNVKQSEARGEVGRTIQESVVNGAVAKTVVYQSLDELIAEYPTLEKLHEALVNQLNKLKSPVAKVDARDAYVPYLFRDDRGTIRQEMIFGGKVDGVSYPHVIGWNNKNQRGYVTLQGLAKKYAAENNMPLDEAKAILEREVLPYLRHIVDAANRKVAIHTVDSSAEAALKKKNEFEKAARDIFTSPHKAPRINKRDIKYSRIGSYSQKQLEAHRKELAKVGDEVFDAEKAANEKALVKAKDEKNLQEISRVKERIKDIEKARHTYSQAMDRASAEIEKINTAVAKLDKKTSRFHQIIKGEHNGVKVGLTFKVLDKEVFSFGAPVIAAGKHLNDIPVIDRITGSFFDKFRSMDASLPSEMHRMRAHAVNRPGNIIRHYAEEYQKTLGSLDLKKREDAYWSNEISKDSPVYKVFSDFLPHFNGKVKLGGTRLTLSDINKFLPETLTMRHDTFSNRHTVESLRDALGSSLKKKQENILIRHEKSRAQDPNFEPDPEDLRILELEPLTDPYEIAWTVRISLENAAAYKNLVHTVTDSFGVKVKVPVTHGKDVDKVPLETQKFVQSLKDEGWVTLKETGEGVLFPPEIAESVQKLFTVFDRREVSKLGTYLDKALGFWKMGATIYNPAYYTRNFVGEAMVAFMAGMHNPAYFHRSGKWSKGVRSLNEADHPYLLENEVYDGFVRSGVKDETPTAARRNGKEYGQIEMEALYRDQGLDAAFLNTEFVEEARSSFKENSILSPIHNKVRRAGERAENYPRRAHFLWAFENAPKHMNAKQAAEYAAQSVRKFHFDYSDVTDFEKVVMMRAFPFYKWTRKAIPLMMQMAFTKPGKFLMPFKAHTAYSNASNPYEENTDGYFPEYGPNVPEWIKDSFGYLTGADKEGKNTYQYFANPQMDIMKSLANPVGTATTMLNPFAKLAIEQTLSEPLNPNNDGPGLVDKKSRLTNLANILPQTKYGNKVLTRKDDAITEPGALMDETTLSFLTGIGAYEDPGFKPFTAEQYLYDNLRYYKAKGEFDIDKLYTENPEKASQAWKDWKEMERYRDPDTGYIRREYYDKYPEKMTEKQKAYFFLQDLIAKYGRNRYGKVNPIVWRIYNAKYPELRK